MQWDVVSIYLLIAVVAILVIGWAVFGRRIRKAAAAKGAESGVDLSARIKLGDLGKLSQALRVGGDADATAIIADAVAAQKRVAASGDSRWTLRVVQPDDITFEWAAADRELRVLSSRETFVTVTGGREWTSVLKAVEEAANAAGLTVTRVESTLHRSAAPVAGDHVWTRQ